MNEFEQGVEYTDDNLVTMVQEDQAAVEAAAGGADTDFVADTTEGANPEGLIDEDGEVIPEGGAREGGVVGDYAKAAGKAELNGAIHPLKSKRARAQTKEDRYANGENVVSRNLRPYSTSELNKQAELVSKKPGYGREGSVPSVGNQGALRKAPREVTPLPLNNAALPAPAGMSGSAKAGMSGKAKAGIAAGIGAAAAGVGAAAYAKRKRDERKGGDEEMVEEPFVESAPVNFADPVEANYASIQSAVGYAMQDHRL